MAAQSIVDAVGAPVEVPGFREAFECAVGVAAHDNANGDSVQDGTVFFAQGRHGGQVVFMPQLLASRASSARGADGALRSEGARDGGQAPPLYGSWNSTCQSLRMQHLLQTKLHLLCREWLGNPRGMRSRGRPRECVFDRGAAGLNSLLGERNVAERWRTSTSWEGEIYAVMVVSGWLIAFKVLM